MGEWTTLIMPYFISDKHPDCGAWATVKEDGELLACHPTKQSAIDQMVAVSIAEDMEPGGEYQGEFRAVIGELEVGDYVRWIADDDVLHGEVQSVDGSTVEVQVYDDEDGLWFPTEVVAVVGIAVLEKIDPLQAVELMGEDDGERSKRERETRTSNGTIEVREEGDGMVFEGYAAVFDSPSQPLPFVEKIERGAFSRSLRSRNDIKLLWNHDTSSVLGSTRAKTLTLTEDDRGLRVRGILPNTTAGRDAAELLRRGDVDAMSFGFTVIKDAWSSDGLERTLKSVRLHEVSIVAFPAYTGTAGTTSVRNLEKVAERAQVDADALSVALEKVEAGEDITQAERDLLSSVLDKLRPEDETPQGDLTMLALKKKKLQLIEGL